MNDDINWDTAERLQVTLDLQDSSIQMIVGNCFASRPCSRF